MRRFLLTLMLLAVIMLPLFEGNEQVSADKYASAIGVKVVVDNNTDVTYTGKHWVDSKGKNQYEYVARINQAPIYNDDGILVDCAWHLDAKGGSYTIIDNIFSATVTGSAITTTYQGQTMSWNPVVLIDSREYTAKGSPRVIAVDPINSNYRNNTLEWDYGVCLRRVRVIEGMMQETWIFDKDPQGTVWIKDNATKSSGFTYAITPYAFDAKNNQIPVNQYKQVSAKDMASATYPVTIDPTVSYVTTTSDAHMNNVNANYNTCRVDTNADGVHSPSDMYIGQQFAGGTYTIWRGGVYFNTSALPDACIISAANLSLYGKNDYTTNDFSITFTSGMPTYPSDPMVTQDFDRTKYNTLITGAVGFNTSGFTTAGYNNISMNATGMSWINVAGVTKFLVISTKDFAGTAPTGQEQVVCRTIEEGAGYAPYLEVTYTSGSVPTVTTNPATYITKTTARMNGYLNVDGGSACNVSFNYSLWNGSAWGANVSTANQSGKVTGESFYADLTGLNNSSTYRFIALAGNTLGASQGLWVNFSTLSVGYEPTNLLCIPSGDSISLSWTKNQSISTYIRYKVGSYPTGSTDGNIVANQSGGSYTHTGLTPGTSYFYRMWGLENDVLTTNSSTIMCTCTAGNVSGATPVAPTAPNTWFSGTNTSKLEDLPFFEIVTDIGDAGNIPATTWWFMVLLGGVLTGGLVVYSRSKNLFIACILVMALLTILSIMVLMPMWIVYAFAIASMGLSWKDLR